MRGLCAPGPHSLHVENKATPDVGVAGKVLVAFALIGLGRLGQRPKFSLDPADLALPRGPAPALRRLLVELLPLDVLGQAFLLAEFLKTPHQAFDTLAAPGLHSDRHGD